MYYASKRSNNSTRVVGLVAVVVVNSLVFWLAVSGFGGQMIAKLTETQVSIVEQPKEEEPPPPPPPPVNVDLPPPPPQVILPDFIANIPPPPTAIQQVQVTPQPARPAEVRPPPPPAPVLPSVRPQPNARRMQEMLTEEYPPRALRSKDEADVTVSMCMTAQGRATNVKVISSTNDAFNDATVKNLPKVPFTPAKDGQGRAIEWCDPPYTLTIQWRLPKG